MALDCVFCISGVELSNYYYYYYTVFLNKLI